MQKSENMMNIIMIAMREVKSLIISNSVAIFILDEDMGKGI
jgi:hypothetical protein